MKRFSNILTSFFLSLIVVWMGVGITIIRCAHTGMIEDPMSAMQEIDPHCNQPMKSDCMKVLVYKLAPTSRVQTSTIDFQVLQPVILLFRSVVLPQVQIVSVESVVSYLRHSPPRAYLNLLRVLLI